MGENIETTEKTSNVKYLHSEIKNQLNPSLTHTIFFFNNSALTSDSW